MTLTVRWVSAPDEWPGGLELLLGELLDLGQVVVARPASAARSSVFARRASSGVAIASRSRRCSSRCRPSDRLERVVGDALVTATAGDAELAEDGAATARAPARSRARRAGWAARATSRSATSTPVAVAIACEQGQLRLALAVLDQATAGCRATPDQRRPARRGSARARRAGGGCGGRAWTVRAASAPFLEDSERNAVLGPSDLPITPGIPSHQWRKNTDLDLDRSRGATMALADIFTRPAPQAAQRPIPGTTGFGRRPAVDGDRHARPASPGSTRSPR